MALSIDSQSPALKDIDSLKRHLKSKGYTTRVVLDDKTMERASALVTGDKRYTTTSARTCTRERSFRSHDAAPRSFASQRGDRFDS
jgi:hypothetical protein